MLGRMASRSRAKRRAQPRPPVSEAGKRTREALLDAGSTVAERAGLAGLSVNAVVAEAELAKGTFYVHFADRDAFLDALHERFHANIGRAISAAVGDLPYGAERLSVGVGAYLDACLAQRAVKPLLREIRAGAHGANAMAERESAMARLSDPNLRAMGCRDVAVTARLLVAMIAETALLELEAGRRVAVARRELRRLVDLIGEQAR
jgi:AcrR family transcriptional regulator